MDTEEQKYLEHEEDLISIAPKAFSSNDPGLGESIVFGTKRTGLNCEFIYMDDYHTFMDFTDLGYS